jgi:hypothetical protein
VSDKNVISKVGGAESGAVEEIHATDEELELVIAAWEGLPPAIRHVIRQLIEQTYASR